MQQGNQPWGNQIELPFETDAPGRIHEGPGAVRQDLIGQRAVEHEGMGGRMGRQVVLGLHPARTNQGAHVAQIGRVTQAPHRSQREESQ